MKDKDIIKSCRNSIEVLRHISMKDKAIVQGIKDSLEALLEELGTGENDLPEEKTPQEATENEEAQAQDTFPASSPGIAIESMGSNFNDGLKTVVLWIYNINQNGTANVFYKEMNQYFTTDKDGNVMLQDMSPEMLAEFMMNLSTAKEIILPDLGLRLILLIYNCNQNGAGNIAEVAAEMEP
ncbi:MAG: hypothetical protein H0Z39_04210 [Peptococcaceae bacterium]|nr:hypothetical protein [Peptococcaceae bacterium]